MPWVRVAISQHSGYVPLPDYRLEWQASEPVPARLRAKGLIQRWFLRRAPDPHTDCPLKLSSIIHLPYEVSLRECPSDSSRRLVFSGPNATVGEFEVDEDASFISRYRLSDLDDDSVVE